MPSRLALTEVEIEKLRTVTASANEAAERPTTAAEAVEATARDTAQAATQEKAALETKMGDLERDLAAAGVELVMSNRQFSEVADQL
jgi:hypothetical protein